MTNETIHDAATSNILAWSAQSAHMQHEPEDEAAGEVDEPPEQRESRPLQSDFKRTIVRKPAADQTQSLLTKALHHREDDDVPADNFSSAPSRRRSMTSNVSLASTADLTSDTGLTSPARTNSPSPPPPVIQLGRLSLGLLEAKNRHAVGSPEDTTPKVVEASPAKPAAVETVVKKRCISFACGPKPEAKKPAPSPQLSLPKTVTTPAVTTPAVPSEQPSQRRTCIKFACPSKPAVQSTPPSRDAVRVIIPEVVEPSKADKEGSPATVRKYRSPSTGRSARSLTPRRRPSHSPMAVRSKKYLTADAVDLSRDSSRFHEFASDEPQEDDWIRQNVPVTAQRLTINDTLRKENEIRRIGREAEEEALQEEFEDELDNNDDEDDEDPDNVDEDEEDQDEEEDEDEDDLDEDDLDIDDDLSGYGSDYSDGYNTDNEVGFADSDGEDDADELELWTHGQASVLQLSVGTPVARHPGLDNQSDSSSSDAPASRRRTPQDKKARRIKIRPRTPELPDSTDFVCGTLDEDRPLEDAYISCIAQRRREKMHLIPQDIDPSFPTSDPEDDEEDTQRSPEDVWIHGELEDLHHEHDRADRRKKRSNQNSPRRYHSPPPKRHHSPPPKRHHSPAPKGRGRSPRRHSPRRMVSPPPPSGRAFRSPVLSPTHTTDAHGSGGIAEFKALDFQPGITQAKSLPRNPALFSEKLKGQRRRHAAYTGAKGHVRGAIDIVKGLEHKRQRRREKYIQKHCNRARKGQAVEKRPEPGKGAQRMRELGLHMAGKQAQQNHYVLSV